MAATLQPPASLFTINQTRSSTPDSSPPLLRPYLRQRPTRHQLSTSSDADFVSMLSDRQWRRSVSAPGVGNGNFSAGGGASAISPALKVESKGEGAESSDSPSPKTFASTGSKLAGKSTSDQRFETSPAVVSGLEPSPSLTEARSMQPLAPRSIERRQTEVKRRDSKVIDNRRKSTHETEEDSAWNWVPLLLALSPAFVGICFTNGSRAVTNVFLLLLMSLYLHFLIKVPHDWYKDTRAQAVNAELQLLRANARQLREGAEEKEEIRRRIKATARIQRWELVALGALFASPVVGGVFLHFVRWSLDGGNTAAGSLISNFNITLFVLSACVRAGNCLAEYCKRRTEDLAVSVEGESVVGGLKREMAELQAELAVLREVVFAVREMMDGGIRKDVDALVRAMRKYERNRVELTNDVDERIAALEGELSRFAEAAGDAGLRQGMPVSPSLRRSQNQNQNQNQNQKPRRTNSGGGKAEGEQGGLRRWAWGVLKWCKWCIWDLPWKVAKAGAKMPVRVIGGVVGVFLG
ncbi:hypothetical protein BZA70DRAFT_275598 [Myxozyma melibiosi]|uniref:Uncharacterized protein n=1 Tax=Myxozyma melibiosi TaxID=54550 RepID=A0ABR1FAF4_9ASCO